MADCCIMTVKATDKAAHISARLMNSNEFSILDVDRPPRGTRSISLSIAIAVSIAAHLMLLLFISVHQSNGPLADRRINIALVAHPPDAVTEETPLEPPGLYPDTEPSDSMDPGEHLAAIETSRSASEESTVEVAAAATGNIKVPAESPVLPARSRIAPAVIPDRLAASSPGGEAQGDKNWQDSVRLDLMNWLERHKRYPIAARRKGVQGAVMVRFVVSSDGVLLEKELLQSSGSKHLDSAAMKLLSRAAPYPQLPEQLLADSLEVHLPIEYRLVVGRHRT